MPLILRTDLNRKLTTSEMDGNFTYLESISGGGSGATTDGAGGVGGGASGKNVSAQANTGGGGSGNSGNGGSGVIIIWEHTQ